MKLSLDYKYFKTYKIRLMLITLLLTFLVLNSMCSASQPLFSIPVQLSDTNKYINLISLLRVNKLTRDWANHKFVGLRAMANPIITDSERGIYHRYTTVSITMQYILPKNYSIYNIEYTLSVNYHFKDLICTNEDRILDFCENISSFIKNIELDEGSTLFLKNIKPKNGIIGCDSKSVEWNCIQDTLKGRYLSDGYLYFYSFTFHDSVLLNNIPLFLGKWKIPQIEQFQKNCTIKYAKVENNRIRVSSGVTFSKIDQYFESGVSHNTIGFFRLSNNKDWSTFPKYIHAKQAAKQFLESEGASVCKMNDVFQSGYTYVPEFESRFCNACGNIIYVEVNCPENPKITSIFVKLIDYYNVGDIGFTNSPIVK